ncbi:MAG: TRAP transporter large permease subunit, partial [Bdellovibrionales bacterium]|nr:TRAP transporter large permease subunit [Bdellovibrionales bacterium]
VAFVLVLTGVLFGLIGHWFEIFALSDFGFLPSRLFGLMGNFTLVAVPLFIFMGITLEKSGLAEELLKTAETVLKRIRSGLPISLVLVGALLAASTGIVGATVVTMGIISLPRMMQRGISPPLACGTIAASGTLGQIIPPSIVLILLSDMMNLAVADVFAAAIVPGCLLVVSYIAYIVFIARIRPELIPDQAGEAETHSYSELFVRVIRNLIPPLLLILIVIGSILFGVASPTESAACGAFGAFLLCAIRKRVSVQMLKSTVVQTTAVTSMVFTLLIGAQVFSVVFRGLYGDEVISDFILGLEIPTPLILLTVLGLLFILGFFLDFMEICFIVVPIVTPLLVTDLHVNGLWLSILIALNLQTSFLTPPFGFALFYLKGVAPPQITTGDIYRGVFPFVGLQIFILAIVWAFPELATALPSYLFGN